MSFLAYDQLDYVQAMLSPAWNSSRSVLSTLSHRHHYPCYIYRAIPLRYHTAPDDPSLRLNFRLLFRPQPLSKPRPLNESPQFPCMSSFPANISQYVIRHYKSGIDVGYVAHPSWVEEEELEAITGPLSIAAAETDSIFPAEKRHKSENILKRTAQPYQVNLYSGVIHGFAVRGDPTKKVERFAKEQAFLQAVQWFDTWLL